MALNTGEGYEEANWLIYPSHISRNRQSRVERIIALRSIVIGKKAQMSINVSEVLASLSQAKEAYEALPDLRRKIDDLEAALAQKDRELNKLQDDLTGLAHDNNDIATKLRKTEEDRDAYGFRAIDAEERLEKVFGVVRQVAPTPSPKVADTNPEQGHSATDPTQGHTLNTGSDEGQSEVPSSPEPLTTTGTTEHTVATKPQSYEDAHPKPFEPLVNPPQAWGHNQGDHGDEDNVVVDKPYLGHPSWEKPHDMTWAEWESKGGTVPGWMKHG